VSAKRWLYDDHAPFYSKGRGRSNMLSEFLVMHQSGPFFQLSPAEYKRALEKYPELDEEQDIDYIERSASASMHVGSDAYFDNSTILTQFERLFKLLEFKECFKNHKIEIIVDNATTHSARAYNLFDFGKGISTRCPVDRLQWVDDKGAVQSLSCYIRQGSDRRKSKGLFKIAVEFNCNPSSKATLSELHQLLAIANHPAFQNVVLPSLSKTLIISFLFPSLRFHD
jgi:hypothetical protein